MSRKQLRIWLEYVSFRGGACLLQMLSARQTARMASVLAWLIVDVLPRKWTRYDVAYDNIARAFGVEENNSPSNDQLPPSTLNPQPLTPAQIHDIIRGMWIHLFRLVAEVVQLPRTMTLTNCREVVVFRNRQAVVKAFFTGRPVLVLGGHFGNWEVSTATFGLFGLPMGIIGRNLDNPLLDAWFARSRQATGHRLIDKRGAAPEMVAMLEAGGNLGLLCDQDAGRKGLFVDFFGRPASTFKSIALMAMQYEAIIVVGYGIRLPDDFINSRWSRFEIGCEDVIDPRTVNAADPIREITLRFTSALERSVRRAPEQYFWVHRRWKSEPRQKSRNPAASSEDVRPTDCDAQREGEAPAEPRRTNAA